MFTSALLLVLLATAVPQPVPAAELPQAIEATAPTVTYKGREVTAAWIDQQYAYFRDKIACVDGKFYGIGKALLETPRLVIPEPPPIGALRWASDKNIPPPYPGYGAEARILRVIRNTEAIVDREESRFNGQTTFSAVTFHVRGIDPAKHVEGARFREPLIYVGIYQSTSEAKRTVQSFAVYKPITREQFVAALADGFELVRYKEVTKKVAEMRGGGGVRTRSGLVVPSSAPAKKVMVDKKEIVEEPVRPPA